VGGGRDDRHALRARLARHRLVQRAERRAGRHDLAEKVGGDAQSLQHRLRPAARVRVVELGGGRVGELVGLAAREPEVQQVGHHQERAGGLQQGRVVQAHRHQLKERVQLHELDAGRAVDLLARHEAEGLLHHAVRAVVAVVVGQAEQFVVAVEQRVVHAPRVHADSVQIRAALAHAPRQAVLDLRKEARRIPVESAQEPLRFIREPVRLVQRQSAVRQRPQHGASALRAQVKGQKPSAFGHPLRSPPHAVSDKLLIQRTRDYSCY